MICKLKPNAKIWLLLLGLGLVSLLFGSISYLNGGGGSHHMDTLLGMFAGFGTGLAAVAVFMLIRNRFLSPQKREEEAIAKSDERNLAVTRAAQAVGHLTGAGLWVVMAFLLTYLDYRMPAYLCVGALYVQMIAFLVAYRVYQKKM